MLQAMLHGKLSRREEDMEDLLTSNTFGMMKYVSLDLLLVPFLCLARDPFSEQSLENWLKDVVAIEDLQFWPTLAHPECIPCEPDVDITLGHKDGSHTRLLIEAKYLSGKSSIAIVGTEKPNDQLAREFDNLRAECAEKGIARYAVIYLTADFSCPMSDLEESLREYKDKRHAESMFYWLSWRCLLDVLEKRRPNRLEVIEDLQKLVQYLNLTMFRRLRFQEVQAPKWEFIRSIKAWEYWVQPTTWRFENVARSWDWQISRSCDALQSYRFEAGSS